MFVLNSEKMFYESKILRCPSAFLGKFNLINKNLVLNYHDFKWCKPVHNDEELFAMLILEIMQAGLNWQNILQKENYIRTAFDNFKVEVVANYNYEKIQNLMKNEKIIRNKIKIKSAINNARVFIKIQSEFGCFNDYIWHFTKNKIIDHKLKKFEDMPIKNKISEEVSFDLKKRGFKFVGPIIIYSYMQAIGIFNDHHINCKFR